MRLFITILANILHVGILFLTAVVCCVGAGMVAFMLHPYVVQAFPKLAEMYNGYPAIALSCFQFLFIPSMLKRLRNFCGVNIKATLVDSHGFQTNYDKMNYEWKAEGRGGGMY